MTHVCTGKGPEGLASFGMRKEEESAELCPFPALDEISLLVRSGRNKCWWYLNLCLHSRVLQAPPGTTTIVQLLEGVLRSVLAKGGLKETFYFLT